MPQLNKWDKQAIENTNKFAKEVENIYLQAIKEAALIGANISFFDPKKPFKFKDYPQTKESISKLLISLRKSLKLTLLNGIDVQWDLSNQKNLELINKAFGQDVSKIPGFEKYFNNHQSVLEAFKTRKENGLNLSDRVWNYSLQFKEEIELGLDIGLGSGQSAAEMARDLKQYLNEPDKLFRRVRDKWGNLVLSKAARAYSPGQGVYRSSYKNAERLAITETNMAYHEADFQRWSGLDFVVGIEVKLSNNHTLNGVPFTDICDDLKGKYPKDFKFIGWHPKCYDDLSEVLTKKGWKFFKDVDYSDKIFTLNPDTRFPEWVDINLIFNREYNGKMVHFHNKTLDCLVTPEHEMIYLNKGDGRIKRKDAINYSKGNGPFYRSCNWIGLDTKTIQINDLELDFNYFCEFMGYWLSDGSLVRNYQIKIAQMDGDPNKENILNCIQNLGFKSHKTTESCDFYSKELNAYLKQFGKCDKKIIPEEILNSSQKQIEIFLNAFISCDGYIRKSKPFMGNRGNLFIPKSEERIYFTTSKILAAQIGELILKIGKRPSFSVSKTKDKIHQFKNGSYIINHDLIRINECKSLTASVFEKDIIQYSGKVYDVTLEKNAIMYIRRNGKCFWGSNCRCHAIPILKSQAEMDVDFERISSGLNATKSSVNTIKTTPKNFDRYVIDRNEEISKAIQRGKPAYWIRDNLKFIQ